MISRRQLDEKSKKSKGAISATNAKAKKVINKRTRYSVEENDEMDG
jgi:hypothetical protein